MKPLVSFIMPAYNGSKYIAKAIESVIRQTYDNWELDIVEDHSSDSTLNVIQLYEDKRIKVHINEENMGISFSSNYSIGMSDSKYIALIDDDDVAPENRLELQVEYLERHPEVDVLGGRAILIDDEDRIIGYDDTPLHNPKLIKAYMHFMNKRFSNGTTMIRRSFLDKHELQFEENCYGMQDWKLMIDCSKFGNISSIDQLLQYKRIHNEESSLYYLKQYESERKEKYASFQRESIIKSGFTLTNDQIKIINDCITEKARRDMTDEEVKKLWEAFKTLITQAYEYQFDFAKEMEYACKKIMFERVLMFLPYTRIMND